MRFASVNKLSLCGRIRDKSCFQGAKSIEENRLLVISESNNGPAAWSVA